MPSLPWVDAIKARFAASSQVEWALDEDYEQPDAIFIAAAHNTDIPRLLRAVEVLGEAVERLTDCLNDECHSDHHGYCQAHFLEKDCSVVFARRALADVREG